MQRKTHRPAHCEPGSITNARELGERLRLSRERLAASELASSGMAWRLWAACADATFGYARAADTIYLSALARLADVHRTKAGPIIRRFDELGVFLWKAAPRGSRGISELALPHVAPRLHDDAHVAPGLHHGVAHVAPTVHDKGNTQDVESSESHRSRGSANTVAPQIGETSAETGTRQPGTPEGVPQRCARHGRAMKLERIAGEDVYRCWSCLDERYGRTST